MQVSSYQAWHEFELLVPADIGSEALLTPGLPAFGQLDRR
jgi:hypothetical protein